MTLARAPRILSTILALALLSACSEKPKEVTRAMQAEAANLLSEAEFANQVRDYARAEPLLAKVVTIIPDAGENWVLLGIARKQLANTSGARTAYKEAISAYQRVLKADPKRTDLILQQAYVHVLLGETDKARSLIDKAAKDFPNDRQIQSFVQQKSFERMIADPTVKANAL